MHPVAELVRVDSLGHRRASLVAAQTAAVLFLGATACAGAASSSPRHAAAANGPIVFSRGIDEGHQELHLVNPGGTGDTRLTRNRVLDDHPDVSPDGTRIAFMNERRGNADIYTMPLRGGTAVRVTRSKAGDAEPSWSDDGKSIAFTSDRGDPQHIKMHIYVMKSDGSTVRAVTHGAQDWNPAWSPDGQWIAFARQTGAAGAIYVVRPDGTDVRRITRNPRRLSEGSPSWSPDSRQLVFFREVDADSYQFDLFVVRVDGTHLRRLTHRLGTEQGPDWSPNGRWIVYTGLTARNPLALTLIRPSGSGRHVISTSRVPEYSPAWATGP